MKLRKMTRKSTGSGKKTTRPSISVVELEAAGRMPPMEEPNFWACAATLDGAITKLVARDVLMFGFVAVLWTLLDSNCPSFQLNVGPVEVAGGAMGLMLVFRNNGGYERWWEGRKLWGQITNAVRTLVQAGLAYGPQDAAWQHTWVHWCASYPHVCRLSLRNENDCAALQRLLRPEEVAQLQSVQHMPSFVSYRLAGLLAEAAQKQTIEPSFLMNMEGARQQLVAAIGKCERIASTPLPKIYVFKIRRFMAMYLLLLPAALVDRVGWATPLLTMLVAYSALGLDRIAEELQSPFNPKRLNHLPMEAMCTAIEANSLSMLNQVKGFAKGAAALAAPKAERP